MPEPFPHKLLLSPTRPSEQVSPAVVPFSACRPGLCAQRVRDGRAPKGVGLLRLGLCAQRVRRASTKRSGAAAARALCPALEGRVSTERSGAAAARALCPALEGRASTERSGAALFSLTSELMTQRPGMMVFTLPKTFTTQGPCLVSTERRSQPGAPRHFCPGRKPCSAFWRNRAFGL